MLETVLYAPLRAPTPPKISSVIAAPALPEIRRTNSSPCHPIGDTPERPSNARSSAPCGGELLTGLRSAFLGPHRSAQVGICSMVLQQYLATGFQSLRHPFFIAGARFPPKIAGTSQLGLRRPRGSVRGLAPDAYPHRR